MALKGKQKNIDANKDGRISAEDFEIMRSRQRGGMKKKMMGGGLTAATQKLKSQGKMGGGMMMKPIMANKGKNITGKTSAAVKEFYDTVPPNKDPRMTGPKYRKYLKGLKEATTASKPSTSKFIQRRMTLGGVKGRLAIPLLIGAGLGKVAQKFFKNKNVGVFPKVNKPTKKMGGGMMNMPGYKKGKSVMAKGCKLGRKKPTKMYT
jgi:hypothetical protein